MSTSVRAASISKEIGPQESGSHTSPTLRVLGGPRVAGYLCLWIPYPGMIYWPSSSSAELMKETAAGDWGQTEFSTPLVGILAIAKDPNKYTVAIELFGNGPRDPSCCSSRILSLGPR